MKQGIWRALLSLAAAMALLGGVSAPAFAAEPARADETAVLAAADAVSAVVDRNGSLWMWGENSSGQLGIASQTGTNAPVRALRDVVSVAVSRNVTAAIRTDGSLWMWGSNEFGQLGNGGGGNATDAGLYEFPCQTVPVKVMEGVASVSVGENYTAAIRTDGSLWMWGFNRYGQLGSSAWNMENPNYGKCLSRPVRVMDDVASVCLGGLCTAAIRTDGSLWMWGDNRFGELGNGTQEDSAVPVKVMEDVASVSISAMDNFEYAYVAVAALREDGGLWTWGENGRGLLGNGGAADAAYKNGLWTTPCQTVPRRILREISAVSMGEYTAAAVGTDGTLWTWGLDWSGTLGNGEAGTIKSSEDWFSELPLQARPVSVMSGAVSVRAGSCHIAALDGSGALWTWGDNSRGALGDGTAENRAVPAKVLDAVTDFALGTHHTLAASSDGSVWTWGNSGDDSPRSLYLSPEKLPGLTAAVPGDILPRLSWDTERTGFCGDNLRWELDGNGLLTIRGTGPVYDYGPAAPWQAVDEDGEPIPDAPQVRTVIIEDGVTGIGDYAFRGCTLTGVVLPDTLEYIGNNAFYECKNLRHITVPDSVAEIGIEAFRDSGLQSAVLPKGLERAASGLFADCGLVSVILPAGVKEIGPDAFGGCAGLKSIVIPATAAAVGDGAFRQSGIEEVYYGGDAQDWDRIFLAEGNEELTAAHIRLNAYQEGIDETTVNGFYDIPAGSAYADAVRWAVQEEITSGTGDATFSPERDCTRAQAVTFLWRALGEPAPESMDNPYLDVTEDAYYCRPVLWAMGKGITYGTEDDLFSPDAPCSRAHIFTFLWRALDMPGSGGIGGTWYSDAVAWADSAGLLEGGSTAFVPTANCPRGDVISYLYLTLGGEERK